MSELLKKQNYGVEVEFTGIATAANGDMYSVVDGAKLTFSVTK